MPFVRPEQHSSPLLPSGYILNVDNAHNSQIFVVVGMQKDRLLMKGNMII